MADPPESTRSQTRHLDATGPREVVYCHQCENEWYQDDDGLVCPRCDGEATEIITPENDPRELDDTPDFPQDFHHIHNHDPWRTGDVPDPDESDLEEHITQNHLGGPVVIRHFSRTFPAPGGMGRRSPNPHTDPSDIMRDFHQMIGTMMGPQLRMGQAGRSGPEALYPRDDDDDGLRPPRFRQSNISMAGSTFIGGGRVTFVSGPGLRPRNAAGAQSRDEPVGDLADIIGSLFGPPGGMGRNGETQMGDNPHHHHHGGMPPGLQGLFASLLNPAGAVHGDAVYSQEALDRIISGLMEQHPTSNAPGPASPAAIAALPKKKLDEKMLGPELKGECSVCMDDVHVDEEVVVLPCSHWFHETCASAWLGEHNTCPICRKGIEGSPNSPSSSANTRRTSVGASPLPPESPFTGRRLSLGRRSSRNEARLDSIRDRSRLSPTPEGVNSSPRRYQIIGDSSRNPTRERSPSPTGRMPGSYSGSSPFRRRDSEISEGQRDSRRSGSRRSSNSGSGSSSGGAMNWLRDRFQGGNSSRRHD